MGCATKWHRDRWLDDAVRPVRIFGDRLDTPSPIQPNRAVCDHNDLSGAWFVVDPTFDQSAAAFKRVRYHGIGGMVCGWAVFLDGDDIALEGVDVVAKKRELMLMTLFVLVLMHSRFVNWMAPISRFKL